jgi:hypothetical protein
MSRLRTDGSPLVSDASYQGTGDDLGRPGFRPGPAKGSEPALGREVTGSRLAPQETRSSRSSGANYMRSVATARGLIDCAGFAG